MAEKKGEKVGLTGGGFDKDLYGGLNQDEYSHELLEDEQIEEVRPVSKQDLIAEAARTGEVSGPPDRTISSKEDSYRRQRLNRMLSPEREDPFLDATPGPEVRTYGDVLIENQLAREKDDMYREIERREKDKPIDSANRTNRQADSAKSNRTKVDNKIEETKANDKSEGRNKKPRLNDWHGSSRWDDDTTEDDNKLPGSETPWETKPPKKKSRWDASADATPFADATPLIGASTPAFPTHLTSGGTPALNAQSTPGVTPGLTPRLTPGMTPDAAGITPAHTPLGMTGIFRMVAHPVSSSEAAVEWTDAELDEMLPSEGFEVVRVPMDYKRSSGQDKLLTDSTPLTELPLYNLPEQQLYTAMPDLLESLGDVQLKPDDYKHFANLFETADNPSQEQLAEKKILSLLFKIKNGSPPLRRTALRTLTEKAREFGPGALFNQILPLMMQSTLEDQERHLLVKVIDRVLYKLDDLVRPYVHKILVVIEPLLIDEDYYARVEGREIISNLAKAAGLATMIATMRPDIDHQDEYVRNTTARAFAVVASALGIPSLILFLRAVCQSKKSWQARHTGIKIVQQIAILMGCAILPHLRQLVEIIAHGLQDEQQKVRTITALCLAALAEASAPYGIEAFDCVLRPLWKGISEHRGKGLAAFLKAIGLIIPLMDGHHASYYTREVMVILVNEFSTADEEMKKIVLKVLTQCVSADGVEGDYIKSEILPSFFSKFWIVRNALDRRNMKQLVETTVELAKKVGGGIILARIIEDLKDPSEPFRKMVMETIETICSNLGVADINQRLEEQLIDGILYAFQEQSSDDTQIMLNGFGTVVNCLGDRSKPYLPQIAGIIRWRLNTPSARVRQQAADLIARIAVVMKVCGEQQMLSHLGLFLFEYLGEEYPEVLGSILGGLKAIVNVIGMSEMSPPVKDLLPRLTPILKNRHEKVQENVIELVGRIADRGGDLVSPKEWDRICFDLLELLKAHKKGIRRATVNTFGYIARTIGPHDVLATLLSNLKVQERQLRVCTTVAIAIVAETCLPYTVLPALMNEYRVPELNVQNGVLKALSFMFEYIGEMAKDYIYALIPLLEDALIDRDLVHRQTAAWAAKHLALGVQGLGCEEGLQHLLNLVWPNIFESSPHLIQSVLDAIDGFRVSLGGPILLQYILQGLFHPARRVREVYWRLYNNVYIGQPDSLVPFYPYLPPAHPNRYHNYDLYTVL